jgi:NAD-dependent deacetylase
VVWFGEALPPAAWRRGEAAAVGCHAMLVVGTSGVVYPAAGLPFLAAQAGATVVEINPEPAYAPWPAGIALAGPAAEALPALVERLTG